MKQSAIGTTLGTVVAILVGLPLVLRLILGRDKVNRIAGYWCQGCEEGSFLCCVVCTWCEIFGVPSEIESEDD